MSDRNYWTALRQRKISRRTMLGASAKAGVGIAGLALVGCGDDDDDAAPAVVDSSAIDAAAGDAAAAAEAASAAADAAGRAAEAAEAASALAAEAAESDDAEQAAAAAQAAADAAADAAEAARAAGDAGAAAVAQAAADAAEAAAAAAREAGAEDTAAAAAAAQAAADAAAAAAAAAGEASAAAAETAAAAVAAAQEAAEAAQEAAAAAISVLGETEDFSVPWPLDEIDLDATIVGVVPSDSGGLDQMRLGSKGNQYSHGAAFSAVMEWEPASAAAIPHLAAPEWVDPTSVVASVVPAPFHDGSILTAHDMVFSYDRMGGKAAYHQGGETTDHPGGWGPSNVGRSAADWVRNEAVDDRTWSFELPGPDAGFFVVNLAGTGEVVIMSQADTEARGDLAMDTQPMGTGPLRFVSHEDDTDFVFERFEEHFLPVDHPVVVSRYAHHKHERIVVRPEIQSQLAGLEAGEIDVVPGLGPNNVEPYLDDPDFTVQFQPAVSATVQVIYPNLYPQTMPDGSPNPFLDFRVRRAANHAINRQSIIDNLLLGQGHYPLFTFSGVYGYPTPEQRAEVEYGYDPELGRQLMAEAGYADGFDVPLYWTTDFGGAFMQDITLAVAQDLAAVGIRTHDEPALVNDYFSDAYVIGGPNRPVGLYWMWANIVRDIGSMWDCCVGSESFFTKLGGEGVQDPALHELYLAQRAELDPERRSEMIAELMLEHARQAWFVFIAEAPSTLLTQADVNWPKGGRTGFMWGGTAFAIQRRKAT